MKTQDKKNIIIFSETIDGICSAFIFFLKYGSSATYISQIEPDNMTGKNLYLLGFTYNESLLLRLISQTDEFLIIDHHDESKQNIESLPSSHIIYDHSTITSILAWKYLFPDQALPEFLQWFKEMLLNHDPDKRLEAFRLVCQIPISVDSFPLIQQYFNADIEKDFINKGLFLLSEQEKIINQVIDSGMYTVIKYDQKLLIGLYLHSPILISEIVNITIKKYMFLDFICIMYYDLHSKSILYHVKTKDEKINLLGNGHDFNLSYQHLDPTPLISIKNNHLLQINKNNINILTSDYLTLLCQKFPNTTLSLHFN